MELPPHIIHVGSIPHNWLFKKGNFIIHHGGFETTASAFQSGKPSLVIPYILDQYLFAQKVADLKVGPTGIPGSKLTLELLINRMSEIINTRDYFINAVELGEKVAAENGINTSIDLIEEFIAHYKL